MMEDFLDGVRQRKTSLRIAADSFCWPLVVGRGGILPSSNVTRQACI